VDALSAPTERKLRDTVSLSIMSNFNQEDNTDTDSDNDVKVFVFFDI
jgi:hypothetical protein